MPVTERLMSSGSWSIKLRPETPRDVLEAIDQATRGFGVLVITPVPAPVGEVTAKQLRTFARYIGIARRNDDATSLAGASPVILLGDEDGKGPTWTTGITLSGTLSAHMTSIFAGATNGIASGTITNPTAGTVTLPLVNGTNQRQAIQKACDAHGAQWRIVANATTGTLQLNAAAPATLWGSPAVLVQRSGGGRDVVNAVRALEILQSVDVEDYAATYFLRTSNGAGGSSLAGTTSVYFGTEGAALTYTKYTDTSEVDPANVASLAAAIGARYSAVRREISVTVDESDIGFLLAAGQEAYIYDPLVGLQLTSTAITSRGAVVHPMTLRVTGMTWPIREGMGVYYCWHSTANGSATDLTPWFVPESGLVDLEVGASPRANLGDQPYDLL